MAARPSRFSTSGLCKGLSGFLTEFRGLQTALRGFMAPFLRRLRAVALQRIDVESGSGEGPLIRLLPSMRGPL